MNPQQPVLVRRALCLFATLAAAPAICQDAAAVPENKPLISRPVQAVMSDNFNRPQLGTPWDIHKGQAAIGEGKLMLQSETDDKGNCRVLFQQPVPNLGLVAKFKLENTKTLAFGIRGNKGGSGYVVNAVVSPKKATLRADTGPIGTGKVNLDPNEWHTLMLEIVGNNAVLQINGKKVAEGQSQVISRYPKTGVALQTIEGTAQVDDITAGAVAPK